MKSEALSFMADEGLQHLRPYWNEYVSVYREKGDATRSDEYLCGLEEELREDARFHSRRKATLVQQRERVIDQITGTKRASLADDEADPEVYLEDQSRLISLRALAAAEPTYEPHLAPLYEQLHHLDQQIEEVYTKDLSTVASRFLALHRVRRFFRKTGGIPPEWPEQPAELTSAKNAVTTPAPQVEEYKAAIRSYLKNRKRQTEETRAGLLALAWLLRNALVQDLSDLYVTLARLIEYVTVKETHSVRRKGGKELTPNTKRNRRRLRQRGYKLVMRWLEGSSIEPPGEDINAWEPLGLAITEEVPDKMDYAEYFEAYINRPGLP